MALHLRNVPEDVDRVGLLRCVRTAYAFDPEGTLQSILHQMWVQATEAEIGESGDDILMSQEVHDLNFFREAVEKDLDRLLADASELYERVQRYLEQSGIEVVINNRADSS